MLSYYLKYFMFISEYRCIKTIMSFVCILSPSHDHIFFPPFFQQSVHIISPRLCVMLSFARHGQVVLHSCVFLLTFSEFMFPETCPLIIILSISLQDESVYISFTQGILHVILSKRQGAHFNDSGHYTCFVSNYLPLIPWH